MRTVFSALVALLALVAVATAAPTEEFSFKDFLKKEWDAFKHEFDELKCPGCHFVLTEVKKELGDAKVDAAIVGALDKVCGAIPDGLGPICEELVDVAAPKVIAWVDGKIDPDALCATVKACPATQLVVDDSLPCFLCTHAMTWVEDKLATNSTEAQVEAELEKLCSSHIVPEKYHATCDALVESYLPQLVEAFTQKLPPKQICQMITLCQKSSLFVEEPATVADSLPCLGCKFAFDKLEQALGSNRTEAAIEAELEKVCSHLGGSFGPMCEAAVEAYFPKLVEMIVNKEPPAKLCQQITLCHAKLVEKMERIATKDKFKCKVCKYTLTQVVKDLNGKPLTPANVEAALDEVCDQLPDGMSFVCESLVDMYDDEITEFVEDKMQPDQICKELHFC